LFVPKNSEELHGFCQQPNTAQLAASQDVASSFSGLLPISSWDTTIKRRSGSGDGDGNRHDDSGKLEVGSCSEETAANQAGRKFWVDCCFFFSACCQYFLWDTTIKRCSGDGDGNCHDDSGKLEVGVDDAVLVVRERRRRIRQGGSFRLIVPYFLWLASLMPLPLCRYTTIKRNGD